MLVQFLLAVIIISYFLCAWMIFTGVVCRLQICRCLKAQWFDSTFRARSLFLKIKQMHKLMMPRESAFVRAFARHYFVPIWQSISKLRRRWQNRAPVSFLIPPTLVIIGRITWICVIFIEITMISCFHSDAGWYCFAYFLSIFSPYLLAPATQSNNH